MKFRNPDVLSGFSIFIYLMYMRFLILILMLFSLSLHSQTTIDMVYNIEPRTPDLELSLSKYEKQTRIGTTFMAVGIVGVMVSHTIITNIKNMEENKIYRIHQIKFLTFTSISMFGVYNIVRAPRHIKKYMY